jgi:hypothetical protein
LTSNDISLFSPSCVYFDRGAHRQQPPEPRRLLTDPYFLAAAIPAVIALGLAKGGFAGVGSIATPLVALILPPFEAAALLLPILIVQDVISVWVYRRDWSESNLKVLLPGAVIGVGLAWFLAAQVPEAAVRLIVGLIGLSFVLNVWFGKKPEGEARAPAGVFWARFPASLPPSPMPVGRPSRSMCCRKGCPS